MIGHVALWAIGLGLAFFIADDLISRLVDWRRERKRQAQLRKYAMSPFKAVQRDWWAS